MLKTIHAAGQRVFLRVERAFSRAFGDAINPLYHLGAISYFMFWIVVASGFYVYAFYETGVDTTFASVERLTHAQWWAGGVMRSLHRYASDAMVLTMLLHLGRHFFFDRYRGFRAFSWITGIVALWLAYVSGVNGYMLPWDRLAQYTVVSTAEWFDALPVFHGRLVRNFILPGAISDRFFSLLQFLHIGIPLVMLAALWVHTQRVPRARTLPPRRLAIGLMLLMLVLSLIKPAISQGAADFARQPFTLELDWFYLGAYPLVTHGHALWLWIGVAGATLVFALAPWLPPLRRGAVRAWQLTVHPGNRTVPVRPAETLLDAGLRGGVPLPFECRSGGCGVCRARVLIGTVDPGVYQASALSEEARARGDVLLCCACALSDVEIELEEGSAVREAPLPVHHASVERLERMAPDVMALTLQLEPGTTITYKAGQYINILLDDGARRAYSFTTRGGTSDRIDLHVRRIPGGRFTTQVFERLRPGDRMRFEGPLGETVLREGDQPIIFVAGATGFAPIKSLLEEAFASSDHRPLYLYWGVRKRRDLYRVELPEQWAREHANFHFVPVLSEAGPEDEWTGRTGLVHEVLLIDFPDLAGYLVYACGSMQMVGHARPALLAHGLDEASCLSDAFTPQTANAAASGNS